MKDTKVTQGFATMIGYTDRSPFEVVKVVSDQTLEIRAMKAERNPNWYPEWVAGGFSAICTNDNEQEWIITSAPKATVFRIRKQKKVWNVNGRPTQYWTHQGQKFLLADEPYKYRDMNF